MASSTQVSSAGPVGTVSKIASLLERLFPVYCVVTALVTFGYALWDNYQIDGDAIAYMDIGDYLRAHEWPAIVNGYWHPMYPAVLSLFHGLMRSSVTNELHAYYVANFAIFVLEMVAMVAFTDAIVRLRDAAGEGFVLERYAMRYVGLALLVFASQRELSLGKVRPDALLQALLLFAIAALLRYLATERMMYAALMGLALGCAYLTKSFAFLFALLCVMVMAAFAWGVQRRPMMRVMAASAAALVVFGVIAGPYIAALSHQKGRLDFGDSGSLNLAWYVGGTEKMHLQPYMTDRFGSADVHLKHPERELLREPQVLSYAQLPYGTYPDWFDTTYWNDQVKPHFSVKGEISRGSRNVVLVVRYLFNHPEGLVLLALLMGLGARLTLAVRPAGAAFWAPSLALGAIAWGIYGIVNTEERYVTFAFLCIVVPVFAALRERREGVGAAASVSAAASIMALLLAVVATGQSLRVVFEDRRQLSVAAIPGGWYSPTEEHAAEALKSMGLQPGDAVACVGYNACLGDFYWARLAGVRILTEIYAPNGIPAYEFLTTLANREQAIDVVRQQGAKVLVADFAGAPPDEAPSALAGWVELGDTTLYELPLNVPAGTVPKRPAAQPRRKPSI